MPRLFDELNDTGVRKNVGGYHFSTAKLEDLKASQYTLVTIKVDKSTSIYNFQDKLNEMISTVVDACKKSARAENLLIRLCTFDHSETEIHGFRLLREIQDNDYSNTIVSGGSTALISSIHEGIVTTGAYAKDLYGYDYDVNAILFILTDGEDNNSRQTSKEVVNAKEDVRKQECLEQFTTILVGIDEDAPADYQGGTDSDTPFSIYLKKIKDECELDSYINIGNATDKSLAKLAQFVSSSISSTSDALANGTTSDVLDY